MSRRDLKEGVESLSTKQNGSKGRGRMCERENVHEKIESMISQTEREDT